MKKLNFLVSLLLPFIYMLTSPVFAMMEIHSFKGQVKLIKIDKIILDEIRKNGIDVSLNDIGDNSTIYDVQSIIAKQLTEYLNKMDNKNVKFCNVEALRHDIHLYGIECKLEKSTFQKVLDNVVWNFETEEDLNFSNNDNNKLFEFDDEHDINVNDLNINGKVILNNNPNSSEKKNVIKNEGGINNNESQAESSDNEDDDLSFKKSFIKLLSKAKDYKIVVVIFFVGVVIFILCYYPTEEALQSEDDFED